MGDTDEPVEIETIAESPLFVLDEQAWDQFQEILDGPPRPNAGLEKLLRSPSVLDG